ncbi:uncharacterized protein LOC133549820 isoform X2 [Nerophis ophidion]|uniref:uncharacterized protein LOC133549820 isoform X2 n=1 Tax=Nerophis ophidion TaxID=159077 RepID=UPI002ADF020A|nr:uncharacterized protein LOC133549820 isoform X2 [Nerophis ophidion]
MQTESAKMVPEKVRHLRPLSLYSRMNMPKGNPDSFPEPFINHKFEIVTSGATKRKLADCHQENDENLAKKPFQPSLLLCSPAPTQYSPLVLSRAALSAKAPSVEVQANVACELTPKPCGHEEVDPCVLKCVISGHQPAFDADVDKLLSLDPSDINGNVKYEDEDKGYLSMYLQPPPTCSPDNLASEPLGPTQVSGCSVPLTMNHQDLAVGGLSMRSPVELLGDSVQGEWNIGSPILESSVCVKVGDCSVSQVGEEAPPNETESLLECSALDSDTSLKVQVKSVVQIPSKPTSSSTPDAPFQKKSNSKNSGRPVVFKTAEDWKREKEKYVQLVFKHIHEGSGAPQDAVGELRSLMAHVGHDASGRSWQHPCDLTCRNYQARLGRAVPKMTLREWQAKNSHMHKRFNKTPKIFQRSPVF